MKNDQTVRGLFNFPFTRKAVLSFMLGAAGIFILVAWLIIVVFGRQSFFSVFEQGMKTPAQLFFGLSLGIITSLSCGFILLKVMDLPALGHFRVFARKLLVSVRLKWIDMILIAFLAGFSEELLFRGAIQPLIGIWWTSLVFTLLHIGNNVKSLGGVIFGLFVLVSSVVLGFIYEYVGLVAAMSYHFIFDIIIILMLNWALVVKKANTNNT